LTNTNWPSTGAAICRAFSKRCDLYEGDTTLDSTGATLTNAVIYSGAAANLHWLITDQLGTPRMSAPPGLTVSAATRLTASEIGTGVRLAEQTGLHLTESSHIGAEFVSAAGKTYDAMGTVAAYTAKNWGNGGKFLASILHHVDKSVDYVAIDLAGASKAQIQAIEKYVSGLTKEQQAKIIYVR
jgi:hypothetical protein